MHSTWGSYRGTIQWFKNPKAQVSAHYTISEDGKVALCVPEQNTAWHAGNVTVKLDKAPKLLKDNWGINPNFITVGIEMVDNRDKGWKYPAPQYEAVVQLTADICKRYKIEPSRGYIVMHKETDPLNKSDPHGKWSHDKFIQDVKNQIEYGVEGGVKPKEEFYPREMTVTVKPEVNTLYVRSEPVRRSVKKPKATWPFYKVIQTNLSGSQKLIGKNTFKVQGFVKGEKISGNDLWWVSSQGNYVWSGGTIDKPNPGDYPEAISDKFPKENKMTLDELKSELEKVVSTKEGEIQRVDEMYRERIGALEARISGLEEAGATEETVEEAPTEEVVGEVEGAEAEVVEEEVVEEPVEEIIEEEIDVEEAPVEKEVVEEATPELTEEEKAKLLEAKALIEKLGL